MFGPMKVDDSDGEYHTVYGPYVCPHCGQPFGGSLWVGHGVVLNGMVHHMDCFTAAVNVMLSKKKLKLLKLGYYEDKE